MDTSDKALSTLRAELTTLNARRDRVAAAIAALTENTPSAPKLVHTPRTRKRRYAKGEAATARNKQIIAACATGEAQARVGRRFGISAAHVCRIIRSAGDAQAVVNSRTAIFA